MFLSFALKFQWRDVLFQSSLGVDFFTSWLKTNTHHSFRIKKRFWEFTLLLLSGFLVIRVSEQIDMIALACDCL